MEEPLKAGLPANLTNSVSPARETCRGLSMRTPLMNNLSCTDALWRNDSAERRHSDHACRISWSPRSRFPPPQARGRPKVRLKCLATEEHDLVGANLSAPHSRLNDRGQSPLSGAVYKNEEAVRLNFRKNARPLFSPLLTRFLLLLGKVIEALLAGGADPFIGSPNAWVSAKMFGQKKWEERFEQTRKLDDDQQQTSTQSA